MVNSMNVNNSYGNIQRLGSGPDNRTVYRVIDASGKEAGKLSVANNDVDKFEKSYSDLMSTAPKIQEYAVAHSSPEDIKKRQNLSKILVGTGALIGGIAPFLFMKKSGTGKKILTSIAGFVAGISGGFLAATKMTSPPGAFKFARATRNLSKIDIMPVMENNKQQQMPNTVQ